MNNEKWDKYYLQLCDTVASNSKCLSRRIGSILVRDKSIISTGYNGPPRGIMTCKERLLHDNIIIKELEKRNIDRMEAYNANLCPRQIMGFKSGKGLEWCPAGHSERNCLINAARAGICTKGAIIYMACGIPCGDCYIELINAGIVEIVCTKLKYYDDKSKYLQQYSDIKVRVFEHLHNVNNEKY